MHAWNYLLLSQFSYYDVTSEGWIPVAAARALLGASFADIRQQISIQVAESPHVEKNIAM